MGVVLLKPLRPVLTLPAVNTATAYMVPALFGGLLLGVYTQTGKTYVKNKNLIAILPLVIVSIGLVVWPKLAGYQGYAILVMIVVTVAWAYLLFKKGVVKVVTRGEENKE